MHNTIPGFYRKMSVENLFSTNTFTKVWPTWQPKIRQILGSNPTEIDILNLGDNLSAVFKTTGAGGRGQDELSAGGTAWESLVCWYLNLCMVGSRCVAMKTMSLVPEPIQDAITINYGNFACNTESDITIIIFPDAADYAVDVHQLSVQLNGRSTDFLKNYKLNKPVANYLAERDFNEYEIGIVQCKTNWNDNAQIPMLWDMIYSANGFIGRNITIGRNTFNLHQAKKFTYSFVTVPTNSSEYKHTGVAVKRVTNLSGGNYWGKPTSSNIARSIKEIFSNNYAGGSTVNFRADIRQALPGILTAGGDLDYFRV